MPHCHSFCSLVTGGANAEVCIRPWDAVGDAERISRLTEPGQPVLALASDSAQRTFAAAFDDNAVRLFSPSGDLRCVVSQTQLPARTLGFSPSGEFLAIAGDDEGVR